MNWNLLAEQSIIDGKQKLTEDEVRSMVGAPSLAEEAEAEERASRNECVCGVINCADEYSCVTSGY